MQCDMCGKKGTVYTTLIEDTEMDVCKECSKYGKVIKKVETPIKEVKLKKEKKPEGPEIETLQIIVDNYAEIIRKKREQLGLKQKEFAKMLSEKESLIHKLETGSFEPSAEMARKFEKILKIKLVEEYQEIHKKVKAEKGEGFTLGDIAKVRKRA